jgi:hypothetical protein
MVTVEQQQRLLKARVALALYSKYGRVPKAAEITRLYNRVQASYAALLNPQVPHQQLTLLPQPSLTDYWRTRNFIKSLF